MHWEGCREISGEKPLVAARKPSQSHSPRGILPQTAGTPAMALQDLLSSILSQWSHQHCNQTEWSLSDCWHKSQTCEADIGSKGKVLLRCYTTWENGVFLSQRPLSVSAQACHSYRDKEGTAFFLSNYLSSFCMLRALSFSCHHLGQCRDTPMVWLTFYHNRGTRGPGRDL